jgi:hypothetical protein
MDEQGRDPRSWRIESAENIRRFFQLRQKHVLYFAGYGELGYEDADAVRNVIARVLEPWPSEQVLVHGGTLLRTGGQDGIAEVFRIAKERGIETSGIHPSVAMAFADTHRVSPYCDHVFFVDDATWGGFAENGAPSSTLRLHLEVSDELVVIGGGKHAADELRAFADSGKTVRYYPAEMNYAFTRQWTERAGVTIPDFRGAALEVWRDLDHSYRASTIHPPDKDS